MWCFALPGLAQRREDIAPNVEYELQRFSSSKQTQIRFDKKPALPIWHLPVPHRRNGAATFANSVHPSRAWRRLPNKGRITLSLVEEEIALLKESWQIATPQPELNMDIDLFDRRQLETVLEVCRPARRCRKPDANCLPSHGRKSQS